MAGNNNMTFWSTSKLRLTLLRIWFVKNILVFLQAALIVCIVLMLTGNITADTPILGTLIYPLFSELIDEIHQLSVNRDIEGLMDFCSVVISLCVSIALFTIKARSIAQNDIKSIKVKKALISANLYFNADGKLVKRQDTNGDGVIDYNDHAGEVKGNFFTGIIDAIKEFIMIANADFSGTDEEDKEVYDNIINQADLKSTAEGLDELDDQMKNTLKLKKANGTISEDEEEILETMTTFSKIKSWITSNFTIGKKDNEEIENEEEEKNTSDIEIIHNNLNEHAEIDTNKVIEIKEPVKQQEVKKVEVKVPVTVTKSAQTVKRDAVVSNYLNKMRGR